MFQPIDEQREIDLSFITCAEYQLFLDDMKAKGKYYQPEHWKEFHFPSGKAKDPVTGVCFEGAEAFCKWLTQKTQKYYYRLPTANEIAIFSHETSADLATWGQNHRLIGLAPETETRLRKKLSVLSTSPLPESLGFSNIRTHQVDFAKILAQVLGITFKLIYKLEHARVSERDLTRSSQPYYLLISRAIWNIFSVIFFKILVTPARILAGFVLLSLIIGYIFVILFALGYFEKLDDIIGVPLGVIVTLIGLIVITIVYIGIFVFLAEKLDVNNIEFDHQRDIHSFKRKISSAFETTLKRENSFEFISILDFIFDQNPDRAFHLVFYLSKVLNFPDSSAISSAIQFENFTEAYRLIQKTLSNNLSEAHQKQVTLLVEALKAAQTKTFFEWQSAHHKLAMLIAEYVYQGSETMENPDPKTQQAALELYWYYRVIQAREAGELPAWEGIRLVRERRKE